MGGFSYALIAISAVLLACAYVAPPRLRLPPHLLGHPIVDKPNFLDETTVDDLLDWTRRLGALPSVTRDTDSYKVKREHIGEAVPINNVTKKCDKPFLIPDAKREFCVFPGRIDVGKHFIMAGGLEGLKEPYETIVSRVQPFIKYIFNYSEHPVPKRLFESEEFTKLAKEVCPSHKQGVLDYFQFNLIVQVPGQTVASHIDAPVFYHANRFEFPQWLLASMVFSGLFQDDFVDQVQVVAYYHKWKTSDGGEFYFWDDLSGQAKKSFPASRSANSVDGSKVVHAAAIYQPKKTPPILDQNARNELEYNKLTKQWEVKSDGIVARVYNEEEIRFGAVYRARCFADKADQAAFRKGQANQWSLDYVLGIFKKDLVSRGVYREGIDAYDLGLLIMKTYISYPLSPNAVFPYNYCALSRLYPWTAPLLKLVC